MRSKSPCRAQVCWELGSALLVCFLNHLLTGEEKKISWLMQWRTCLLLLPFYLFHIHFWICSVDWIILTQYFYVAARGMQESLCLDALERQRGDWVCSRYILWLREKRSSLGLSSNVRVPPSLERSLMSLGGMRTLVIKDKNEKLELMFVYCIKEYILEAR